MSNNNIGHFATKIIKRGINQSDLAYNYNNTLVFSFHSDSKYKKYQQILFLIVLKKYVDDENTDLLAILAKVPIFKEYLTITFNLLMIK